MKKVNFLKFCLLCLILSSCNTEALFFEKEFYWQGHWERLDKENEYFSSGFSNNGAQFYFSTIDTISSTLNPHKLLEFNYKKKWKLFQTYDGQYIKIIEIEPDKMIEIIGPVQSKNEIEDGGLKYVFLKEFMHPLIPDSLLYGG